VVLAAAVIGKFGGCWLGARLAGESSRDAAAIAALMNTRALMGLVAINIGLELGLLSRELFTMLVIMALATTVMTVPLLRLWLPAHLRGSELAPEPKPGLPATAATGG
jgi:Kef-type K+ transport system membrane component KefB